MPSTATRISPEISERMRKVRSKGTLPELLFRKALRSEGLRYKIAPANLAGKPDLVVPEHGLAIFIDGDFWHGGQWQRRGLSTLEEQFESTDSKGYWIKKIAQNGFRDCAATDFLISQGWTVLRFWESEVLKNLEACVETCLESVHGRPSADPFWMIHSKTF